MPTPLHTPMLNSSRGSGPHDRVPGLAFQPVGLPEFRLGGAPDQDRLAIMVGVDAGRVPDALGLRLSVTAGQRDVICEGSWAILTRDLTALLNLLGSGKLKPIIDRELSLADTNEAFRLLEDRLVFGKVIVKP